MKVLPQHAVPLLAQKLDAASNAAAAVTITPNSDEYVVIDSLIWSYDGTPTGGSLTVTHGSTDVLEVDIKASGPGQLVFADLGFVATTTKGTAVVITLAAGGAGVTGKLTVAYR